MGPEEDHNVLANRTPLGNRSHGSRPDERPTTQWRLQACCDRRQAAPFYHRKPQPAPTLRLRPRLGPSQLPDAQYQEWPGTLRAPNLVWTPPKHSREHENSWRKPRLSSNGFLTSTPTMTISS